MPYIHLHYAYISAYGPRTVKQVAERPSSESHLKLSFIFVFTYVCHLHLTDVAVLITLQILPCQVATSLRSLIIRHPLTDGPGTTSGPSYTLPPSPHWTVVNRACVQYIQDKNIEQIRSVRSPEKERVVSRGIVASRALVDEMTQDLTELSRAPVIN